MSPIRETSPNLPLFAPPKECSAVEKVPNQSMHMHAKRLVNYGMAGNLGAEILRDPEIMSGNGEMGKWEIGK